MTIDAATGLESNVIPFGGGRGAGRAVFCRVALSDRSGRILLVRYSGSGKDTDWMLPGGALGRGETLALAATRRLHEQLGVLAWPHCVICISEGAPERGGGTGLVLTCAASIISGVVSVEPACNIVEARWFSPGRLPDCLASEAAEALGSQGALALRVV